MNNLTKSTDLLANKKPTIKILNRSNSRKGSLNIKALPIIQSHSRKASLQNPSIPTTNPSKSLFNKYSKFPLVKAKLQAHIDYYSMSELYKCFKIWQNLFAINLSIITNTVHFESKYNSTSESDDNFLSPNSNQQEEGLRLKNGKLVKSIILERRLRRCFRKWYEISKQKIFKRRITIRVSKKENQNIGLEIKKIHSVIACEKIINYYQSIELNNKEACKLFCLKKWLKNSKTIYNINSTINERRNSQVNVFTKSLCRNHYITRKQLKINRIMSPILSSSRKKNYNIDADLNINTIPSPKNDTIKPFSIACLNDTTHITTEDYHSFLDDKKIDFSMISLNDKSNVSEDNINIRKIRIRKVYKKRIKNRRNISLSKAVNDTVNQTSKLKQMKVIVRYIRNEVPKKNVNIIKRPVVQLHRTKVMRVEDINIGRDLKCDILMRLITIVHLKQTQDAFDKFAYVAIRKYHTVKRMRIRSVLTQKNLTKILRLYLFKWHKKLKYLLLARITKIDSYSILQIHFKKWKSWLIYRYGHSKREDDAYRFFLRLTIKAVIDKVDKKTNDFILLKRFKRWKKPIKKNVLLKVKHVMKRKAIPIDFIKERIERVPVMTLKLYLLKWNSQGRVREVLNENGKKRRQLTSSEYRTYNAFMQKMIVYSSVDMKELNRFYMHWKKHVKMYKRKRVYLIKFTKMIKDNTRRMVLKVLLMK